jgi:hypothetical protein
VLSYPGIRCRDKSKQQVKAGEGFGRLRVTLSRAQKEGRSLNKNARSLRRNDADANVKMASSFERECVNENIVNTIFSASGKREAVRFW